MTSGRPDRRTSMTVMENQVSEGYADANGVRMYWRSIGEGGTPLVVVHGGFGVVDMSVAVLERLAHGRRVVAVELQGHGHTRDIDREFSCGAFGADLAALGGQSATTWRRWWSSSTSDLLTWRGTPWARPRACGPRSSTPTGSGGWSWCP